MKSKIERLKNRGYAAVGIENKYVNTSFDQRLKLLKCSLPTERTIGARLLAKNSDLPALNYLIEALKSENKLYTKIELCNSIVSFGNEAVKPMASLLGCIGKNQYSQVPESEFKKNNYPLPRDIAARVLIRIGLPALPVLFDVLLSNVVMRISEAIDAIGFICFYNFQPDRLGALKDSFYSFPENKLIKWKIVRAMSAFPESELFLKEQKDSIQQSYLHKEIERSLKLLMNKNRQS